MWSADIDPRVLHVRARPGRVGDAHARLENLEITRRLLSDGVEHLLIERAGTLVRLDIVEGSTTAGPFSFHFDLPDDGYIQTRMEVIQKLVSPRRFSKNNQQLRRHMLALQTVDLREAGASLRDTAEFILGPGAWPGDGDHRKSAVRRYIRLGEKLMAGGPSQILSAE